MAFLDSFKALSEPLRRDILVYLRNGEKTVSEVSGHFGLPIANMSYHLGKLKEADLVREKKQKNYVYYELNTSLFEEIMVWFGQFKGENEQ